MGEMSYLDSKEWLELLVSEARQQGAPISERQEKLARGYGLNLEGVSVTCPVPVIDADG